MIYANDPSEVDYTAYGIENAILIDNTGKWRDREGLSKHLRPGIDKVVLTAPGKGDVPNIVHGVNHDTIKPDEQILSCASCTTNAIVPPLKAMDDEYGVLRGHVETVHSFTNDQNLLDNYHKADRRGRSAPLNMVITETGAASAVAKALPELKAPITGSSIRVPVPDVSIAILSLRLGRETTRDEVLEYLRDVSLHSPLKRQIDFTTAPDAVSMDFVGSRHASIVDSRRDQGRRRQRDPLPLVRQRVRLLVPGHPGRPARLRRRVPDLPGPGGLIPARPPARRRAALPPGVRRVAVRRAASLPPREPTAAEGRPSPHGHVHARDAPAPAVRGAGGAVLRLRRRARRGIAVSSLLPELPIARYDLLLLYGIGLTVVAWRVGWDSGRDIAVIAACHATGLLFELVKVRMGSWSYPEEALTKVGGVPLYGGFLYAALGSYVCRARRLFDLRLTGYRPRATAVLAAAVYVNFFSHHWLPDARWVLAALILVTTAGTWVRFRVGVRDHRMPLALSFVLIGFFLWVAENAATYVGAWSYPDQLDGWQPVSLAKFGAWALLMTVTFVLAMSSRSVRHEN